MKTIVFDFYVGVPPFMDLNSSPNSHSPSLPSLHRESCRLPTAQGSNSNPIAWHRSTVLRFERWRYQLVGKEFSRCNSCTLKRLVISHILPPRRPHELLSKLLVSLLITLITNTRQQNPLKTGKRGRITSAVEYIYIYTHIYIYMHIHFYTCDRPQHKPLQCQHQQGQHVN